MVTTGALLHGDRDRFLRFDEAEHPVALQLGGSDPAAMAECAKMAEDFGYDEVNINCGCPSDRVQKGAFGACLMAEPDLVAKCVEQMSQATTLPVTVKCRIGIDEQDSFEFLDEFVDKIADKGCKTFIIHARKAWLKGLSPKENREIPELDYDRVELVNEKHPQLSIILNGGIRTVEDTKAELSRFDGVMIGREAYHNPYILAEIEREVFGNENVMSRIEVAKAMIGYIEDQQEKYGTPIKSVTRHMMGLFHGQAGGKSWRRALSELPFEEGAKADLILDALPRTDKIAA
jgi:tRNA-dihydrouridine synthase A